MDIIVTTPKNQMAAAARDAAECLAVGGGKYFRRFAPSMVPKVYHGDRVYYVEDGFVRGFCLAESIVLAHEAQRCDTTGRKWPPGYYLVMDATTWQWIRPIPTKGFRGFRYVHEPKYRGSGPAEEILLPDGWWDLVVVGGWRDPRPEVTA